MYTLTLLVSESAINFSKRIELRSASKRFAIRQWFIGKQYSAAQNIRKVQYCISETYGS